MIRPLSSGLSRAARAWRAVFLAYLAGALFALPAGLVVGGLVDGFFGGRAADAVMARGLDPVLALDFVLDRQAGLSTLPALLGGLLVLWALASPLLHAVSYVATASATPLRFGELLALGGRFYGRLLRLAPLTWLFVGLCTFPFGWLAYRVGGEGLEGWTSERQVLAVRVGLGLGVLAALALFSGAADATRVVAVALGEHRARWAFLRGLARAARRPLSAFGIPFVFGALAVGATLVVVLLDVRLPRAGWGAFGLGVLLQQGAAALRAYLRVARAGAMVDAFAGQAETVSRPHTTTSMRRAK